MDSASDVQEKNEGSRETDHQHLSISTKKLALYLRHFFPLGKLPCWLFVKSFKSSASEAKRQSELDVGFVKKGISPAPSKSESLGPLSHDYCIWLQRHEI